MRRYYRRRRSYSMRSVRILFDIIIFLVLIGVFFSKKSDDDEANAENGTDSSYSFDLYENDSELETAEMSVIEADEPESSSEEESSDDTEAYPDLTPVQTDSPVDAYYADVPRPDFSWKDAPKYSGDPSAVINGGVPFLEGDEMEEISIWLTPLDKRDRCGACMMLAGPESMPTQERGSISGIKPSGWKQGKYSDLIEDQYLYNRCHLLMYALSGMNATEENLITGTRYMNATGMLEIESQIVDYIEATGHHVLYRVTPLFNKDELVARGVLMEALSLEDDDLSVCVYCYNVQPGIKIDYKTGANERA